MVEDSKAEKSKTDPDQVYNEELGEYKLKSDPRKSPEFDERKKICTRTYPDPTGKLKSDEQPEMIIDLVFCQIKEKCCGLQEYDVNGKVTTPKNCCNTYES